VGASLVILLGFATRLTTRIRRLHAEAEDAIDSQGRVRGSITATKAQDEIGDLTRTTAAMLARLKEYNAYLEAMAGRLSHELRTPVAVVRSSLDNLQAQDLPADARVYVDRAGEGVDRLGRLISRLSEATRLERLLESAERERFDLNALVASCLDGYRAAYAPRKFEYVTQSNPSGSWACRMRSPRPWTNSSRTRWTSAIRTSPSSWHSPRRDGTRSSRWRTAVRRFPKAWWVRGSSIRSSRTGPRPCAARRTWAWAFSS
jgi:signal transduction histidine kinase